MKRRLLNLALVLLSLYGAVCLLAWVFQARLVYFPAGPPELDPSALGLAFETVELTTSDGVALHGWFLPAAEPKGTLLFCHGNAGHVGHRLPAARVFLDMGLSVLLFDYRGYGRSAGTPSETGTYLDAEAAYDHLVAERGVDPATLTLYGESLGAAVALELARRRPAAALVLESAFTSIPAVGARHYPWLPVRWLGRIRYDNLAKIGEVTLPKLLVHSPDDEIVPFAHARELLEAAKEPKSFLETEGGHNDGGFTRRGEWRARVEAFLIADRLRGVVR